MNKLITITRDIEGAEKVRKIVSVNPDKYEWKEFYKMLDNYAIYCYSCGESHYVDVTQIKTFKAWLDTEI